MYAVCGTKCGPVIYSYIVLVFEFSYFLFWIQLDQIKLSLTKRDGGLKPELEKIIARAKLAYHLLSYC